MRKYYITEFENEELSAVNEIEALTEAVEKCSLSIFGKYALRLQNPIVVAGKFVVIEVGVPDNIADSISIGRLLRSISDYLVHNHGDKYTSKKNYRLLRYTEIPKPELDLLDNEFNDTYRMELMAKIVELFNKRDDIAIEKIKQISKIIYSQSPEKVI